MTIEQERQPVFQVLEEMKQRLKQDTTLGEDSKTEMLGDVDAIRTQLKKREPNRSAIAALLEPIGQVVSVAGQVAELIKMINQ